MPNFLSVIKANKIPVSGLVAESSSTAPASPVTGQLWTDTVNSVVKWWDGTAWQAVNQPGAGTITNTQVATGAAIAYSKLNLTGSIVNADVSASAAIAYSKLNLTGNIVNSDISSAAAIAFSKLASPIGAFSFGNQEMTNLGAPTAASSAARLQDVQNAQAGISVKPAVRAATTTAGTLATSFANGSVIDGVTLATGDRILVKNQATGSENGLYTVNSAGAPTRTSDSIGNNTMVFVEEGTTLADTAWIITNDGPITVGTTSLTWAQFGSQVSYTFGNGLQNSSGTVSAIAADGSITVGVGGISVGVVPINKGGTNATTAAGARTNLSGTGNPLPQKYSATITTVGGTPLTVTHNLNSQDLTVQLWDAASAGNAVYADITQTDANNLTVTTTASQSNMRIVVIG